MINHRKNIERKSLKSFVVLGFVRILVGQQNLKYSLNGVCNSQTYKFPLYSCSRRVHRWFKVLLQVLYSTTSGFFLPLPHLFFSYKTCNK